MRWQVYQILPAANQDFMRQCYASLMQLKTNWVVTVLYNSSIMIATSRLDQIVKFQPVSLH